MSFPEPIGTRTVHRCGCGHNHLEHADTEITRDGECSTGWCACRVTRSAVIAGNPAVQIPTWKGSLS